MDRDGVGYTELSIGHLLEQARLGGAAWCFDDTHHVGKVDVLTAQCVLAARWHRHLRPLATLACTTVAQYTASQKRSRPYS